MESRLGVASSGMEHLSHDRQGKSIAVYAFLRSRRVFQPLVEGGPVNNRSAYRGEPKIARVPTGVAG